MSLACYQDGVGMVDYRQLSMMGMQSLNHLRAAISLINMSTCSELMYLTVDDGACETARSAPLWVSASPSASTPQPLPDATGPYNIARASQRRSYDQTPAYSMLHFTYSAFISTLQRILSQRE